MSDPRARKRAAAMAALGQISPGELLGVGSGTTVNELIDLLASMPPGARPGACVAASVASEARLRAAGIPVKDLRGVDRIRLYIDGADSIDPRLRMLKGGGAAHVREKILASAAERFVCIADESKVRPTLAGAPVALEIVAVAAAFVARRIGEVWPGAAVQSRAGVVSDNGNPIVDVMGIDLSAHDPAEVEAALDGIPGVVGNGIFAARPADVALLASDAGVGERVRPG
jgi:ribose 5-phosphate isomerase A